MSGYHALIFGPHVVGPDGFRFAPHVGEFYTRMRIDGSQAKADAVRAAADAGAVASKSFGDKWKATFSKENIGKGLLQGLGLGFGLGAVGIAAKGIQTLTDAITGSFDAARGWESAMAGVSKTLDTTGLSSADAAKALGDIEDGLREMAQEIPTPVEELASLAEAGGALGIARQDLLEFTRTAALLGTTTDVAAQDAATALGKIGAVIPFTREEYSRFAATLVDLGNKGASTESEIVAMAQNMAGAAALVGLSKPQLLAWASALANVGEEAEAGGSSFQRFALQINSVVGSASEIDRVARIAGVGVDELVSAVEDGADAQERMAEATGVSVKRLKELVATRSDLDTLAQLAGTTADEFSSLWEQDASAAMQRVIQGLSQMDSKTRQATLAALEFKDVRITRALLALSSNVDNLNGALGVGEQAWQDNSAAVAEAEKRFATTDSKIALIQNRLHDWAIDFGNVLIDGVGGAIETIDGLADAWHNLERFTSPHLAELEDMADALDSIERKYGISAAAARRYYTDNADAFEKAREEREGFLGLQKLLQDTVQWAPAGAKNEVVAGYLSRLRVLADEAGLSLLDFVDAAGPAFSPTFVQDAQGMEDAIARLNAELKGTPEDASQAALQLKALQLALAYQREQMAEETVAAGNVFWQAGYGLGTATGAGLAAGVEDAAGGGSSAFGSAAEGIVGALKGAISATTADVDLRKAWFDAGTGFVFDLSAGVRKGVDDSEPELKASVKELQRKLRFNWDAEAAFAMGKEFIRAVGRGFRSTEPELVEDAQDTALGGLVAMDRAGRTGPKAADRIGTLLTKLYASGMTRAEVEARLAGEGVNLAALEKVAAKKGWFTGGFNVADAWVDGFIARMIQSIAPITGILDNISDLFNGESPPPKGPLSHIDRGGYNVGTAWRDAFLAGIGIDPSAVSAAMPGLAGLGLSVPVSVAGSLSGDLGQVTGGHSTVDVNLDVTPETVAALSSAGYDAQGVVQLLYRAIRSASDAAGIGYLIPEGL